jgi:TPR repeat protein
MTCRAILLGLFLAAFSFSQTQYSSELTRMAEKGNANAEFILGRHYEQGDGVPQDYAQAAKWYRKAADQGNADAAVFLGLMYYSGKGVPQDHAEALKLFRKAADRSNAKAQTLLGMMYFNGQGAPPALYAASNRSPGASKPVAPLPWLHSNREGDFCKALYSCKNPGNPTIG